VEIGESRQSSVFGQAKAGGVVAQLKPTLICWRLKTDDWRLPHKIRGWCCGSWQKFRRKS